MNFRKWKAFTRAWVITRVQAVPLEAVEGLRGEHENQLAAYLGEVEDEKARRRLAERERDRARAALQEPRWSDGAALGYAAMAAFDCGLTPSATVGLLEQMEGFMETVSQKAAAEYGQNLMSGGPPEWVGPGAELKPRDEATGNRQQGTGERIATGPAGPRNDRTGDAGRQIAGATERGTRIATGPAGPRNDGG